MVSLGEAIDLRGVIGEANQVSERRSGQGRLPCESNRGLSLGNRSPSPLDDVLRSPAGSRRPSRRGSRPPSDHGNRPPTSRHPSPFEDVPRDLPGNRASSHHGSRHSSRHSRAPSHHSNRPPASLHSSGRLARPWRRDRRGIRMGTVPEMSERGSVITF